MPGCALEIEAIFRRAGFPDGAFQTLLVGSGAVAKIIADRTENGPFRTAEDLMRVPGIGAKKFESLKDMVVVR